MRLTYNKDALGKEIAYCGTILGVSSIRWEFMHGRMIRSYVCFHPVQGKPISMENLTGYEEDNAWVDINPKFGIDSFVTRRKNLIAGRFSWGVEPEVIEHYEIVKTPKYEYVMYRLRDEVVIEEMLIPWTEFQVAQDLHNANKRN